MIVKMSSECYVSLSHSSSEPCAASWSEDQRIAVTTNEVVYVLTLRVPLSVVNTHDSPSSADNERRLPLFITSTVPAPIKSQLSALELGSAQYTPLKYFPPAGNWPFMEIIDPALQPQDMAAVTLPSCDLFKSSDWTPPGCSALGGCLLSCLTRGGRLLLYAPPGLLGNQWRLVMDLTAQHNAHMLTCDFTPQHTPTATPTTTATMTTISTTPSNGTTTATAAMTTTSTTPDNGTHPSPHQLTANDNNQQTEPQSKSDASDENNEERVTSESSSQPHRGFVHRRLSLTVTCFAWLPALVKTELNDKATSLALVAMATRLGHVILMGVEVPLDSGCESNVMTLLVFDGFMEGKKEQNTWISSLRWTRRGNGAWLGVGLTDGTVGMLHWSDLSLSLLNPSLSLLWTEEDSAPVHCLAWDHPNQSPTCPRWLAASKGSLVVLFDVMNLPNYALVSGIHSVTVSDICSLSTASWQFVSTSLDGTLQTFQPPMSHDSHVTPSLITMETVQQAQQVSMCTQSTHVHGIAMSKNSLYAAVVINQRQLYGRPKTRERFQLHFLPLIDKESTFDISSVLWSWDVVEYLRGLSEDELVKVRGSSASEPRVALHVAMVTGKDEAEVKRCKDELMSQNLSSSLRRWVEWREERDQQKLADQTIDDSSSLSLRLMCHWLSVLAEESVARQPVWLAKKVLGSISSEGSISEPCPACGEPLPTTNLYDETCPNGHTWKRCGITLCLVADTRCGSCMQCGTIFNNALSLPSPEGSWILKLLEEHSTCLFCGGHFEQVM